MKKICVLALLFLFTFSVSAKKLQAYLSYSTFSYPSDGPYIETYLSVVGKSVEFVKNSNNKFQATIQISMVFRQNDTIKNFKKIDLFSPEIEDTSKISFAFTDQQRFSLPNGDYEVEISIMDLNKKGKVPYKTNETISMNFPVDKVSVSGIQLIESYVKTTSANVLTKNGYDLVPFTMNFYPSSINNLTYYAEIYNTDKLFKADDKFIVNYYIESFETKKTLSNYFKYKKETPKNVIVNFNEFDISNLPSGNYNLVIEIKDKDNKIVAFNKLFFQRSNPHAILEMQDIAAVDVSNTFADKITNIDTLKDFIKSTFPVSTQMEKIFAENHIKKSDLKTLQQYFLNFWINRNAGNPAKAWGDYYSEVQKVNKFYSTSIKRGYETDRGRVYLQYGAPNNITESVREPSAYPYEIWQYYTLNTQKNRKFVFYLPDLITNDYEIIHSDAFGEIYNPSWQLQLEARNVPNSIKNNIKGEDYYGGKADDYFKNPH